MKYRGRKRYSYYTRRIRWLSRELRKTRRELADAKLRLLRTPVIRARNASMRGSSRLGRTPWFPGKPRWMR